MSYKLSIVFEATHPLAVKAAEVERRVFEEEFGLTVEQIEEEFADSSDNVDFVVVQNGDDEVVGVARVIAPGEQLKSISKVTSEPWGVPESKVGAHIPESTMDVCSISVVSDYRRRAGEPVASLLLLHGIHLYADRVEADHLMTVLDKGVLDYLKSVGFPFVEFANLTAKPYLNGVEFAPVILNREALSRKGVRSEGVVRQVLTGDPIVNNVAITFFK